MQQNFYSNPAMGSVAGTWGPQAFPGTYNYMGARPQVQMPVFSNPMTEEEHKLLLNDGGFNTTRNKLDVIRDMCTHKHNGQICVFERPDHLVQCSYCGKVWEMKDNYTKLAILKTDKETGKPLAGAVLQLLKADGTVYKEWTTTDKEYRIDYIPIGTYTLHEKTAPAGYVKFKDQTIVIKEQDFIDEQAKDPNYIKRVTVADGITTVDIDKTSITDGKKVIGAHLVIKDSKGKVFAEWDTTEQSHTIKRMPVGEYTLTETFAPNGYVIANTIKFTVKETSEIQKVHMIDDITKLEINKYRANAKTNEDKPLAGAQLIRFMRNSQQERLMFLKNSLLLQDM